MAGFDFEFRYSQKHEPIVRVCLSAARVRARTLEISWRWRTVSPGQILVTVDGNSRRTDFLGYRLERDLPLVAEGCDSTRLKPRQRRRLGRGFADLMLRGRHTDEDRVLTLRGVADTRYYYPPYEFECPRAPRLHARLSVTREVIVNWNFGEVAPEVVLEELHTAVELVLEELVNRRAKRLSFAQLVLKADEAGLLPADGAGFSSVELLIQLKDLRKDVRHRAAEGARPWIIDHWDPVALLIEGLVSHVNAIED